MISPTSTIQLELLSKGNGQFDQLVVSRTATLNGILALNFSNGFAPRAGDVLTFIKASQGVKEKAWYEYQAYFWKHPWFIALQV